MVTKSFSTVPFFLGMAFGITGQGGGLFLLIYGVLTDNTIAKEWKTTNLSKFF